LSDEGTQTESNFDSVSRRQQAAGQGPNTVGGQFVCSWNFEKRRIEVRKPISWISRRRFAIA